MKKFIRSKIDKTETSNRSSPNNLPDPPNAEPAVDKIDLQSVADKLESNSDASLNNADNENEEYHSPTEAEAAEGGPPQEDVKRPEAAAEEAKPPESTVMCRDFIRGTCKRPGTCRYAHKCDKTQLFSVYTFCRNFQNKICTLPNCKYVHASVFEEQEFYRTGKLPPNVMAPKCQPPPPQPQPPQPPQPPQLLQPPLPPPPGDPAPESRVDIPIPTSFSNPPPQLPPSMQLTSSLFACPPTNVAEARMFQEEFGAARDISYGEPPAKKCKSCESMEVRYRCLNELLDKKREELEELKGKMSEVDKNKDKMVVILKGLIKLANKSGPASAPSLLFNTGGGDKYKLTIPRVAVAQDDESTNSAIYEKFIELNNK